MPNITPPNNNPPIPKTIYYCWFGGNELTKLAKRCIKSWKKFCPDYEIVEINETNFDINYNEYVKEAYQLKKWAFVSDVARFYYLVNFGGVYFDTDLKILKPINHIIEHSRATMGFEPEGTVGTAFLACNKGNALLNEFLKTYDDMSFERSKDERGVYTTNVVFLTMFLVRKGLLGEKRNHTLTFDDVTIYTSDYFYPNSKGKQTVNTVAIHHGAMSYISKYDRFRNKCFRLLLRLFGEKIANGFYKLFGRNRT